MKADRFGHDPSTHQKPFPVVGIFKNGCKGHRISGKRTEKTLA
jgi:hypothetical protein